MFFFWEELIRPVLDSIVVKSIVEIGALDGANTKKLLEFCEFNGCHIHVIDPKPTATLLELVRHNGERLFFHQSLSLDVIGKLTAEVYLIDGDHNWYTVFHELRVIEEVNDDFPIVFLHDIGWPYGRRDLYYDPSKIPSKYRHGYSNKGMVPGHSELHLTKGLSPQLNNANHEGGPRNGVLTAVEDFISKSSKDYLLFKFPVFFGLGILLTKDRFNYDKSIYDVIQYLNSENTLKVLMRKQEELMISYLIRVQELSRSRM